MRPKLNRNPNRGKRSAARLAPRETRARKSPVKSSYRPGQTVASRIAGIQAWYDRQAQIAAMQ